MGDGTKENPYTREDVLKAIEKNGGTADGLDLSGKEFEREIDLRKLDLRGIILKEARLLRAHLEEAELLDAHLEKAHLLLARLEGAYLTHAYLEGADLRLAHLERAYLIDAHLEGARLTRVTLSSETKLQNAHWGNYILGEERRGEFDLAVDTYRQLKTWHTNAGIYDIAGEFFYREMEAKRKAQSWKKKPHIKLWGWVMRLLCGYGERPWQVVLWGMLVLFGLALLYFFLRGVAPHTLTAEAFLASLYYSAVSFTALGYGPWFSAGSVRSWAQGLGAAEAIIGVFMIALFLITFTRKMTR